MQILKTAIAGALIGAALFWMPFFVLKVAVFVLIIGAFIGFFRSHRWRGSKGWAFADRIRGMSDEDYSQFKEKWGSHHCRDWKNTEKSTDDSNKN